MKDQFAFLIALLMPGVVIATGTWDTRRIASDFYAEGAGVGDIDGDGKDDIAYGPLWFSGPQFSRARRFADGKKFSPLGYADNFFSFVRDFTGDGRNDNLVVGFPGKDVRLYVNPGPAGWEKPWPVHVIANQLSGEAPALVDLIPGGLPELVCSRDKAYGYYAAGEDATQPWTWQGISPVNRTEMPFGHGMGVGDVNGDGRLDVVEQQYWYEQPETADMPWIEHRWVSPGTDGAQILVDDVDGDGDADFITSLRAHGSGIAWFEQTQPGIFARHDIVGASSTENSYGVTFREPHGMALADIDGDGLKDFVSGKRWLAHNGRDAGAYQEPVVYWFRKVKTAAGVEFVPHLVDNDSGIGVGVPVGDLNGDGKADIVSANKRGLAVHFQTERLLAGAAERWRPADAMPQERYAKGLPPEEARKNFAVPPGFAVDLIASEPQLTQPVAMCFDARGRLWVAEGNTYPQRAPEGQGKDRILILADADSDGTFESRKVFAEVLNLVSGIQVGFGGVFVGAAPYLMFIPDQNGDDVPDAKPEMLLDGWGYQDTHETLNSLTWGPDGWLYGCQGVFTQSNVGKPGAPDSERQRLNACVWRWHPVRRVFEVFSEGASNPWGVDFDAHGDAFITACVIPHLFHVSQGGRYSRQAGQHFNPYVFDDIETIADHRHYVGRVSDNAFHGPNRDQPPAVNADTSALGGGHAHSGLAIYEAEVFPPAYRGNLFFSNLHGHRVLRERLERDGSGHIARHMPDFALARDTQFIGVSVLQGPDGALYVSDWSDKQTCHHRDVEIWDRSNGRIYRIRHGEARGVKINLAAESDAALVQLLSHPNVFHARQAQRLLHERVTFGKTETAALKALIGDFEKQHAGDTPLRLRAFWTLGSCGLLSEHDLIARLGDSSEHMRGWALQFLGEKNSALPADTLAAVERHLVDEPSMVTRRFAASLLQRLPLAQRWNIAASIIAQRNDQNDPNTPLLAWYGIEPLVEADAARALRLSDGTDWAQLREFIARRAALFPAGREALMTSLASSGAFGFTQRATSLLAALAQMPPVERPAGWEKARAKGESLGAADAAVLTATHKLGARFGDADFFAHWRAVARDPKASAAARIEAIELLQAGRDPELGPLARSLLDETPLLPATVRALRDAPGAETAQALVARLDRLPLAQRNEAINLLATRPEMALVLLQAVDAKKLAPSLISPVMLDQFARFEDAEITALIDRHWTRGGAGVDLQQLASAIKKWKGRLNERALALADAGRGRRVFQATCGICHPLFGEGVALGPDLTGSNRANLSYILENVLSPSAVVGRDYLLNVITLKDGSVASGIVRRDTPEFLTLAMPGGTTTDVKKTNIADRRETPTSLMPAGLFDALPFTQVADLVKYLASPAQVPLPAEPAPSAAHTAVPPAPSAPARAAVRPPGAGAVRIEAESLRPKNANVTGGELRTQEMSGFRNDTWSGRAQLFWVNGQLGHTLTLTLPDVAPGTHDLTLTPTLARDYGRFRILIAGDLQEADLYHGPFVKTGAPVIFRNVTVATGEPLRIVIEPIGANAQAQIGKYGYVFGLDCIDVSPAGNGINPTPSAAAAPAPRASAPTAEPVVTFAQPASGPLHVEQLPGTLSIRTSGPEPVELARFVTQAPADTPVIVPSAAYVHPLRTPRGIDVTAFAPEAHRYYRGLFMGYVDVRGTKDANYWGGGGGPIQGSVIVSKKVSHLEGASFHARNEWQKDGTVLVQEEVQATAHLDGSATLLDLVHTFTAVAGDVRLAHCNVGGLALPVRYDGQLTAHGPDGPMKLPSAVYRKGETNWPESPWYGYTVSLPGGTTISAAILNHPANPETRWHCALGARVINPNITTHRDRVLKEGEPLILRYRVVALDGDFDAKQMSEWVREFGK